VRNIHITIGEPDGEEYDEKVVLLSDPARLATIQRTATANVRKSIGSRTMPRGNRRIGRLAEPWTVRRDTATATNRSQSPEVKSWLHRVNNR